MRLLTLSLLFAVTVQAELRVPAFTAYFEPRLTEARISEKNGITGWTGAQEVVWFGQLRATGSLHCAIASPTSGVRLRLSVASQSREATVNNGRADFGAFTIAAPGYHRFSLELLDGTSAALDALLLDGPAVKHAHFNLQPRRNAASVHLSYPQPKDAKVAAFYCEVTAMEDPPATFYMATGWHRGYFGMQVINATERWIIFSVWDSGGEAIDRKKVGDADRVALLGKGEDVVVRDFGHEGTGGHSHLVYPWRSAEPQRFVVTAKPADATHTIYSGHWFHPDKKQWMLISSWRAPKDGSWLRGLYSFNEDFGGLGQFRRKALFGNQWFRTTDGQWQEVTNASFSHDATGNKDRLDRFMGIEDGQFFLSNGGFVPGFTRYGKKFTRPATGKPTTDFTLP